MLIRQIPSLKVWHLIGIVATVAAFLAVQRFRLEVFDPNSAALRDVQSSSVLRRRVAVARLYGMEPQAETFEALKQAIHDSDAETRDRAVESLSGVLHRLLANEPPGTLAALGPTWEKWSREAIRQRLTDPDPRVRATAAFASENLGQWNEAIEAVAFEMADHLEIRRHNWAAHVLGIHDAGNPKVQALAMKQATSHDMTTSTQGLQLLGVIWGPSDAVPSEVLDVVEAAMKNPDITIRERATVTAGQMAWRSRRLLPALIQACYDDRESIRAQAFDTLSRFRYEPELVLPTMKAVAATASEGFKPRADEMLARFEREVREFREQTLPASRKELTDPDPTTRRRAAEYLTTIGPPTRDALPELIRALNDPDARVRVASAVALGKIDPKAASDALTRAAQTDADTAVQNAARAALDRR